VEIAFIPRWILAKLTPDRGVQAHLNVLISNTFVVAIILLLSHSPWFADRIPHFCLSERLFGIPCPGCGMTGALIAIPSGRLAISYQHNPGAIPFFMLCLVQIPLRTLSIAGRSGARRLTLVSRNLGNAVLVVVLIVWVLRLLH